MTKIRETLSVHSAVFMVCDFLGWDMASDITKLSDSQLRKYSDADTGREISLRNAIKLDGAFIKAGGFGAPIFEAYRAQIGTICPNYGREADAEVLAGNLAMEAGEAVQAVLKGRLDPKLKRQALKEVNDAALVVAKLQNHLEDK